MLENTFPIIGPRMVKAAITTIATKTRINAYSTRPWPFSLGANNMGYFLLSSVFLVRCSLKYLYFTRYIPICKRAGLFSPIIYVSLTALIVRRINGYKKEALPSKGLFLIL